MNRQRNIGIWVVLAILVLVVISGVGSYNGLVASSQAVDAQWGQVQNVYQRRADLVPNLVATVKGAANFEKSTYVAVAQARASVGSLSPQVVQNAVNDPQAMAQFEKAQNALGSSLSRLLVTVENYPQLKANENFLTLQSQLEGTENRIAVERKRYNDLAQAYNTRRNTFPTIVYAGIFGKQFGTKSYFQANTAAQNAPQVQF
ncbi:MAG TPA: LemA family protein [Candidatus Baltobacteraceae bacterium]|nr:LemA family protein [Candidatus Baltobacteraceae bacterium]